MKFWSVAALYAVLASSAFALPHGAATPPLVLSPSASSMAIKSGSGAAVSSAACGTTFGTYNIAAVGGGGSSTASGGYAIVAGLAASTTYYCQATVGGVTSVASAATTAAQASTPIISLTVNTSPTQPVNNQITADTFYNCISNDNVTYNTYADSQAGWGNTGTTTPIGVGKFTSESPWTGVDINYMTGYGVTGGPPKANGLYCLDGKLLIAEISVDDVGDTGSPSFGLLPEGAGNIIVSPDHGATWANFQAPTTFLANGAPTNPATTWFPNTITTGTGSITGTALTFTGSHVGDAMTGGTVAAHTYTRSGSNPNWAVNLSQTVASAALTSTLSDMPTLSFVMYGPDDGTLGYRVDNADAYVYLMASSPYWESGSHEYLARVPRNRIASMVNADVTYYTGGDGSLDANWSSSSSAVVSMLDVASKLSITSISYIPSLNRYLMWQWHYPDPTDPTTSVWETYEAPHPWGPTWTKIDTQTWVTNAFYNPVPLQRTLAGVTANGTPLTLAFAGNYHSQATWYHFWTTTVVVNTH